MKKIFSVFFIILWGAFFIGLAVYYVLEAPRESAFSQEENRMLSAMPELSLRSFLSSELSDGLEDWLLDHFPDRNRVIAGADRVKDGMSIATYGEYIAIAGEGSTDPLDSEVSREDIDSLLDELSSAGTPCPEAGTVPENTAVPEVTASPEPQETASAPPQEDPPIERKPEADIDDYPAVLGVYAELDGATVTYSKYKRENVLAVTAVLNQYAKLLPQDGKLLFTVVPQSSVGNRFVNSSKNGSFYSTYSDVVNAFGLDNVYSFDAAGILSEAILKDEYVYFRSDMHWTPYGTYLVYREMAARAGKSPCDYENDFDHSTEDPFLGTYYRDNPTDYMRQHADSLELLSPRFPFEWRRVTGKDEYKLIDFLDFNAKANDRYTVYLGGPAGPWTYTDSENGEEENCLVITDSFGLGFIPFVVNNYRQVHYYDPRYYKYDKVGYTVAEMIEKYSIQDIYVVIGDLHSFDSSFLLTTAREQLGLED